MDNKFDNGFEGLQVDDLKETLGEVPQVRVFPSGSKKQEVVGEELDPRFELPKIAESVEEPLVTEEPMPNSNAMDFMSNPVINNPAEKALSEVTDKMLRDVIPTKKPSTVDGILDITEILEETEEETEPVLNEPSEDLAIKGEITPPIREEVERHVKTTIPYTTQEPDPELVEFIETGQLDTAATILPSKTSETQQRINRDIRRSNYDNDKIIELQKKISMLKTNPELAKDPDVIEYFEMEEYLAALDNNRDTTGIEDSFFQNPDRKIMQGVRHSETNDLMRMKPVEIDVEDNESDAATAMAAAAEFFKVGENIHVPLPSSGFWVIMAPVPDAAIAVLYGALSNEKSRLGKRSLGLTYTNISVKLNEIVFKFLLNYIEATSIEDLTVEEAMKYCSSHDIHHLFWGCARGRYTLGYLYRRLCSANEECKHIEEQNLDLESLIYYDDSMFTDKMREIFSKSAPEMVSLEEVKLYQSELMSTLGDANKFKFMNAEIEFRIPTAYEHFSDGNAWIEDIEGMITEALMSGDTSTLSEEHLLDDFLKTSYIRIWSHYVKSAKLGNFVPKGRAAINSVLTTASSKRAFFTKFVTAVVEFRNKSIISAIGIEEYTCTRCGDVNVGDIDKKQFDSIIPLETLHLFFMMFHTRYQMVMEEESL